jgi:2'-5' RNA ligase
MGGTISLPTYIVIELPEPMATKIRRFRKLFDKERAALPAEITITGSCGVGPISRDQDLDDTISLIDGVAAAHQPFDAAFDKLAWFSSSHTYYLSFKDPAPFKALHDDLAKSGIHFDPTPYPFTPHCTLKLRKRPADEELFDLFFLKIPKSHFTIDTLGVYCLHSKVEPQLLHRVKLGKTSNP